MSNKNLYNDPNDLISWLTIPDVIAADIVNVEKEPFKLSCDEIVDANQSS